MLNFHDCLFGLPLSYLIILTVTPLKGSEAASSIIAIIARLVPQSHGSLWKEGTLAAVNYAYPAEDMCPVD